MSDREATFSEILLTWEAENDRSFPRSKRLDQFSDLVKTLHLDLGWDETQIKNKKKEILAVVAYNSNKSDRKDREESAWKDLQMAVMKYFGSPVSIKRFSEDDAKLKSVVREPKHFDQPKPETKPREPGQPVQGSSNASRQLMPDVDRSLIKKEMLPDYDEEAQAEMTALLGIVE